MFKELGLTFKNIILLIIRIICVLFIINLIIGLFILEKNPIQIAAGIIVIIISIIIFQLCNPKFWKRVKARKENKE